MAYAPGRRRVSGRDLPHTVLGRRDYRPPIGSAAGHLSDQWQRGGSAGGVRRQRGGRGQMVGQASPVYHPRSRLRFHRITHPPLQSDHGVERRTERSAPRLPQTPLPLQDDLLLHALLRGSHSRPLQSQSAPHRRHRFRDAPSGQLQTRPAGAFLWPGQRFEEKHQPHHTGP